MTSAISPSVALISMPWITPSMPSIQLATLEASLRDEGISSEIYEFNMDYAARIGIDLYRIFSRSIGFTAEWVFSRCYCAETRNTPPDQFLKEAPSLGLENSKTEKRVYAALDVITKAFLDELIEGYDWGKHDIVGFSLCLTQLGASVALADRIKKAHPDMRIVFGGAQCKGVMGESMMRLFPFLDCVVQVEGEGLFPEIVRRMRNGTPLTGLAGVCHRDNTFGDKELIAFKTERSKRSHISFDPYFERLEQLGLKKDVQPWIPFESGRGCWYGEKAQCSFCGLDADMRYQSWPSELILNELERQAVRYGINRFFAVDLILPKGSMDTLLPEIESRGHDWQLFYEVRPNLPRDQLEQLARSGVRWIQPGIESLDKDLLRLMRKGSTPTKNIQLLKWSRELGIRVGWNLISGIPGETPSSYRNMIDIIPKLFHLAPPSGVGRFQLHRFSPYFEQPEHYGIKPRGAHPLYQYVFPFAKEDLDDLFYLHDYRLESNEDLGEWHRKTEQAVRDWWGAYRRGARLTWLSDDDNNCFIRDSRPTGETLEYQLDTNESSLYHYLDSAVNINQIFRKFSSDKPETARRLGGEKGIRKKLHEWEEQELILIYNNQVLALAVEQKSFLHNNRPKESSPATTTVI